MSVPKVGVALLGAGIFAKEAHVPVLLSHESIDFLAVYSRSHKTASTIVSSVPFSEVEKIKIYSDDSTTGDTLPTLLSRSDIHAVVIALPIVVQPDYIEKCLEAGKHVLCEKPVAKDMASAREIIKIYKEKYEPKGLLWVTAENFGFETAILKAGEIVKSGKLGTIRHFSLEQYSFTPKSSKYYNTPWRTIPDYQGGFLLDGGVHSTALLSRVVLHSPVVEVSAYTDLLHKHLAPEDSIRSIIKLEDGTKGTFNLSFGMEEKPITRRWLTVLGSEGALELLSPFGTQGYKLSLRTKGSEEVEEKEWKSDGIVNEIGEWIEAIKKGIVKKGGPEFALLDLSIIEACLNSGKDGKVVKLADL
ncbi:NAD(P)-binding protein [Atractiella rhizophila]|nr:NAD(P)-binding protein [Atractiella rhizophila]